MKKYLFSLLMLTFAAAAAASNDTIADVRDAHRVVLTETGHSLKLKIRGNKADSTYVFDYERHFRPESASYISERKSGWLDFNVMGFMDKKKRKKGKVERYAQTGGMGFGFVSAVNAPEGMEVDMGASWEIFANLLEFNYALDNRRHTWSVGLDLNWRNYRMTNKQRFVKSGTDIVLTDYPEGAEIDFSRIKIFSLPVTFQYAYAVSKHVDVHAAAIVNFNTYGSIKTRYKVDGHKVKDITKGIHQRSMTVDFRAGLKICSVGFYAKYSPCEVINSSYGPKFNSFSAGVMLFY